MTCPKCHQPLSGPMCRTCKLLVTHKPPKCSRCGLRHQPER